MAGIRVILAGPGRRRVVCSEVPSAWVELPFRVANPIEESALRHSPSIPDPTTYVEREVLDVIPGLREAIHLAPNRERRVVAKAEHLPGKANPRFVVTSLPADTFSARTVYERVYCPRGDMENTIKEQQLDLFSDRTSASRFDANQLRLLFSAFASILFDVLRRTLVGTRLARATAGTLRLKLLKIGARVTVGATGQGGHGLRPSLRCGLRTGPRPITRVTFHPLPTSSQARSPTPVRPKTARAPSVT